MSTVESPSNVLIVMPRWVGDAVMATPLIEALHEAWPHATIDLLLKRYLRGLFDDVPWAGRELVIDGDASFWRLRSQIARDRYDVGVLLPNSLRPALLLAAARVRRRVGYRRNGRGPLLSHGLSFPRTRPFRMIDFYGALGERVGIPGTNRPMKLHVTAEARHAAAELLTRHGLDPDAPLLGLNPGAKYGSSKLWPAAQFAAAADDIVARHPVQMVILAGPGEDELAADIARQATADLLVLPSAEVDLAMLKAVLTHVDVLITNDTGPRHMAVALGVPAVTVYGPTHATWGGSDFPLGEDLFIEVDCGPCMQRECPHGHHRCMTDLEPRRVADATVRLLAGLETTGHATGSDSRAIPLIVDNSGKPPA